MPSSAARAAGSVVTHPKGTIKMATKTAKQPAASSKPAAKKSKPRARPSSSSGAAASSAYALPGMGQMPKMPNMLTAEQAIELYKANAALALDIINAAIDGTAKLRQKQFEGEETARAMGKKAAKTAAEAHDAQSLMQAGQGVAQEAIDKSMRYWGEMFDLIVEIQKRLFTLMEEQAQGMPGVKQAKAALAMMPDLKQMQNVVSAMQGVVSSGAPAFESMQRVMADFAKMAQSSMPGMRR
jgi:Phasin protein